MIYEFLLEILNLQAASKKSSAERVIDSLEIELGNSILDIGAGGGYFSYKFSQKVGADGKVIAVDIDKRNLEFIMRKSRKNKITNIKTYLVKEKEIYLQSEKVDIIFLRDVFHDINDKVEYFKNIQRILKDNGKVAIIDFLDNGISKESRTGHCSNENKIIDIMNLSGYYHYKRFEYLEDQSYNIFKINGQS